MEQLGTDSVAEKKNAEQKITVTALTVMMEVCNTIYINKPQRSNNCLDGAQKRKGI